jgi:hypothetical protein
MTRLYFKEQKIACIRQTYNKITLLNFTNYPHSRRNSRKTYTENDTSEQIRAFTYSPSVILSICNCDVNIPTGMRRMLKELANKTDHP